MYVHGGGAGLAYTGRDGGGEASVESCLQPPSLPPGPYMMPQVDRGLAMWQVQADWQYWRTVW